MQTYNSLLFSHDPSIVPILSTDPVHHKHDNFNSYIRHPTVLFSN